MPERLWQVFSAGKRGWMEYNEFLLYTEKCIADFMGESFQVSVNHVTKNNGIILDGLVIMREGQNISPTIYMEPFFEDYCEGKAISDIIKEIIDTYEKYAPRFNMDMRFFKEYKTVKKKVVYRLVNYAKNMELLKTVPHRRILDMALICCCMLIGGETGSASIIIQKEHLDMWDIAEEELFQGAGQNTQRLLGAEISDIGTVMKELIQEDVRSMMQCSGMEGSYATERENRFIEEVSDFMRAEEEKAGREEMYILTNHLRLNGATCMIYPDVLRNFANEKGCDLFVLPSSVHEVLLVPVSDDTDPYELNKMLIDVNRRVIHAQDVLSNSVYHYNRNTDKLYII